MLCQPCWHFYWYLPLGEGEWGGYRRHPSGAWKGIHKHNLVLTWLVLLPVGRRKRGNVKSLRILAHSPCNCTGYKQSSPVNIPASLAMLVAPVCIPFWELNTLKWVLIATNTPFFLCDQPWHDCLLVLYTIFYLSSTDSPASLRAQSFVPTDLPSAQTTWGDDYTTHVLRSGLWTLSLRGVSVPTHCQRLKILCLGSGSLSLCL